MSEFLAVYGLFLAKTITWLAALLALLVGFGSLLRSGRESGADKLEIKNVNQRLSTLARSLDQDLLSAREFKQADKSRQKAEKRRKGAGAQAPRIRLFVLDFEGDLQASAVTALREEISAILQVARDSDEVLLRLESAGGLVHAYGLAASQLARLRDRKLRLTVVVDKVAASGGYMMACVADRILAAPFAVVGSIGVVAQLPNFNRLLRKHDIDFELHTAGAYKRTLTVFGENTDSGRAKFQEEIDQTHELFKTFVSENRPILDVARVATGEHWFGTQALALKLIDGLSTSDDHLLARARDADVFELHYRRRQPLSERLKRSLLQLGIGGRGRGLLRL